MCEAFWDSMIEKCCWRFDQMFSRKLKFSFYLHELVKHSSANLLISLTAITMKNQCHSLFVIAHNKLKWNGMKVLCHILFVMDYNEAWLLYNVLNKNWMKLWITLDNVTQQLKEVSRFLPAHTARYSEVEHFVKMFRWPFHCVLFIFIIFMLISLFLSVILKLPMNTVTM